MRHPQLILLASLAACTDPAPGLGGSERIEVKEFQLPLPRRVDFLFVVDNSPAMAPFRTRLLANAKGMMDTLLNVAELRDAHIGVITGDLGTRGALDRHAGAAAGHCAENGDAGILRQSPLVSGAFLVDRPLMNGTHARNYTGAAGDALASLLDVGSDGCEIQQPFEAVRRALSVSPYNVGFRRPDAWLAVIFITAGDDHSVLHWAAQDLTSIDRAYTMLHEFADDPIVSVIAGNGVTGCTYDGATAGPSTRLQALAKRLPNRSVFSTICQQDLSGGLSLFASVCIRGMFVDPCFESVLADLDPVAPGVQPECSVSLTSSASESLLPACGAHPCYEVVESAKCATVQRLELRIDRGTLEYPDEPLLVHAACLTEASP